MLVEGRARRLVLDLYAEAQRGWPFLSDVMERAFRKERVPVEERGEVAGVLQDLVRLKRKIEWALPNGEPSAVLLGALLWTNRIAPEEAKQASPDLDVERLLRVDEEIRAMTDPVERIGLLHSFPEWLVRLFVDELGEERADALAASLNLPAPQTLRVNTLMTTREHVLALLNSQGITAEPTAHSPVGVTLVTRTNVFKLDVFQEGFVEVQDEASQLVAEIVAPPPKGTVVDACAGAGGKTLALGAMLGSKGRVVALDVNDTRLDELKRRARRAGLSNVQALHVRADGQGTPVNADRVLVDAPCSGVGALRRNPEARWRLGPADVERLAAAQHDIAVDALKHIGPGGRLIYATCSFLRAEGESVVERIAAEHPELQPVAVREVLGRARTEGLTDERGVYLRTWPDRHGMDGFFTAVLRKKPR